MKVQKRARPSNRGGGGRFRRSDGRGRSWQQQANSDQFLLFHNSSVNAGQKPQRKFLHHVRYPVLKDFFLN